jgi:hypothetical protein
LGIELTGAWLCPVVDFGISGLEPLDISSKGYEVLYKF